MPLKRDLRESRQGDPFIEPGLCRFPLTDGTQEIWGQILLRDLEARAVRDSLADATSMPGAFERYRDELESLASELFDAETYGSVTGETIVRIPPGRF